MPFFKLSVLSMIFLLLAIAMSPVFISSLNASKIDVPSEIRLQYSRPVEIILHSDSDVYVRGVIVGVSNGGLVNVTYGLYNAAPPSWLGVFVFVRVNLYDDNGNIIGSARDLIRFTDIGFQASYVTFTGINILDVKTVEVSLSVIRL